MTLEDDHPSRVISVGIMRMTMFHGVVQTLTHMKHVPDLKKNLLSLGYLQRSGFGFSFYSESGVLNIMKGAMVVMKGKRLENNLHQLVGSVIYGGSETAAAAHNQQDLFHLWHYRLGHMGEQGMRVLMKNGRIP